MDPTIRETAAAINKFQTQLRYSTVGIAKKWVRTSRKRGFADNLRGVIKLLLWDYRRAPQKEQKLEQREIDRRANTEQKHFCERNPEHGQEESFRREWEEET